MQDYSVVHTVRYPAPLLCIGLSPDDSHLVTGMTNGLLSIRRRKISNQEQLQSTQLHAGTYRYFIRGKSSLPQGHDVVISEAKRKPRLRPFEKFLRRFQYKSALDAALAVNVRPITTITVLDELRLRRGLVIALSGRDDVRLEPILTFVVRNITNPRYTPLLLEVALQLLDLYSSVLGQSMIIDELFLKLCFKVDQEIAFQKQLMEVLGALEMLLGSNDQRWRPSVESILPALPSISI